MKLTLSLLLFVLVALTAQAQNCPSNVTSAHCAVITWTPQQQSVSVPPITEYHVYRTTQPSGCSNVGTPGCLRVGIVKSPNPPNTAPYTVFVDTDLQAQSSYFWVVTAVNKYGEGYPSAPASFITGADMGPTPPSVVGVSASGK